jgi:hypothetical protein
MIISAKLPLKLKLTKNQLQTCVPSEQFLQMSISCLFISIAWRKARYFEDFQMLSKVFSVIVPKTCLASLSKQQGTIFPSQVNTLPDHMRQQ